MILETLFTHGSDYIEWYEASGNAGTALRRVAPGRLQIALSRAPRDLQLVHKATATALWRKRPLELSGLVAGRAGEADLLPPAQTAYALEGEINDPSGAYLPRRFSLACGAIIGHRIGLYRSPLGSRYGRAGGLFGRIRLAGKAAAILGLMSLGAMQLYFGLKTSILLTSGFFVLAFLTALLVNEKRGKEAARAHEGA